MHFLLLLSFSIIIAQAFVHKCFPVFVRFPVDSAGLLFSEYFLFFVQFINSFKLFYIFSNFMLDIFS